MNGLSFGCLSSPEAEALMQHLQPQFKVPSRRTLQRRVHSMYEEVTQRVESYIKTLDGVSILMDGWEDHQKFEGISIHQYITNILFQVNDILKNTD